MMSRENLTLSHKKQYKIIQQTAKCRTSIFKSFWQIGLNLEKTY